MMNFKAYGNSRPSDYIHTFQIEKRNNTVTESGRVVKAVHTVTDVAISDGILAEASEQLKFEWSQNQRPITHTIVSYRPIPSVLKEKDVLILTKSDGNEQRFSVQGMDDAAGNSRRAIIYVLERRDVG